MVRHVMSGWSEFKMHVHGWTRSCIQSRRQTAVLGTSGLLHQLSMGLLSLKPMLQLPCRTGFVSVGGKLSKEKWLQDPSQQTTNNKQLSVHAISFSVVKEAARAANEQALAAQCSQRARQGIERYC